MTDPDQPAIRTRPLFTLRVTVGEILPLVGPSGTGRRVGIVSGGDFEGARLRGRIEPGNSDWQTVLEDGATLLDVRTVLRTDDGALIAMSYTGVRRGPPEIMARVARGEPVDPADYYFRITASFSTADDRYAWINRIVAVGTGERPPEGPVYQIHEVI